MCAETGQCVAARGDPPGFAARRQRSGLPDRGVRRGRLRRHDGTSASFRTPDEHHPRPGPGHDHLYRCRFQIPVHMNRAPGDVGWAGRSKMWSAGTFGRWLGKASGRTSRPMLHRPLSRATPFRSNASALIARAHLSGTRRDTSLTSAKTVRSLAPIRSSST